MICCTRRACSRVCSSNSRRSTELPNCLPTASAKAASSARHDLDSLEFNAIPPIYLPSITNGTTKEARQPIWSINSFIWGGKPLGSIRRQSSTICTLVGEISPFSNSLCICAAIFCSSRLRRHMVFSVQMTPLSKLSTPRINSRVVCSKEETFGADAAEAMTAFNASCWAARRRVSSNRRAFWRATAAWRAKVRMTSC